VKAILLAGLMALVFVAVMTAAFRVLPIRQRVVFLGRLWIVSVPVLLAAYVLTPPDLWLLPAAAQDDPAWFGPIFCVGLWFAGFFGGVLQLYQLTERGMSLRMLVDVAEAGAAGLDVEGIMSGYSRDQGIAWMYQKRLDGLVEQQVVRLEDGTIVNTARGRRLAALFGRLRRLLRLDAWT
jgi:hypothetical protein